jgi:hypothetical protein
MISLVLFFRKPGVTRGYTYHPFIATSSLSQSQGRVTLLVWRLGLSELNLVKPTFANIVYYIDFVGQTKKIMRHIYASFPNQTLSFV